jgi:flagellar hook-associated protein 1
MSSTFGILESARSGLNASQLGLDITSQNIANSDTKGYTRQALDVSSKSPDTGAYRFGNSSNKVGQGVDVNSVYQVRNSFLDVRYRYENSSYSMYNSMDSQMTPIEDKFAEITGTTGSTNKLAGLGGALDDITSALGKYELDTTNTAIGTDIETKAKYLTDTIRGDYKYLTDALASENKELQIYVTGGSGDTSNGNTSSGINGMIKEIQELNGEIASYEVTGNKANDLRDQRNMVLDDLSSYVDIDTTELPNGMVTVKLQNDSTNIIDSKNSATEFEVSSNTDAVTGVTVETLAWGKTTNADGTAGVATKVNADGTVSNVTEGTTANLQGGIVKAYLNVINGDGTGVDDPATGKCGNVGIPYLIKKLNEFAQGFMDIMNNTNGDVADAYGPIDTSTGNKYTLVDQIAGTDVAASIKVSDAWIAKPDLFTEKCEGASEASFITEYHDALSSKAGTVTTDAGKYKNGLSDFADSIYIDIASAVGNVEDFVDSTKINATNLDSQRKSISSVSTNDEGVNIIKYQQAYNANARVITAIDEMLDKLINGTGKVGL